LTDRYLSGDVPAGSRMSVGHFLKEEALTEAKLEQLRALAKVAEGRGQSLAQLALAWALRDNRMTSLVIGASSVAQLEDNIGALANLEFSPDELHEIDKYATG